MAQPYSADAYESADKVIAGLKTVGHDYTAGREEIARLFDEELWHGNWDSTTSFVENAATSETGLRDLRLIQEDEFDQSMDEDEADGLRDEMLGYWGHYVFLA